MENFNKNSNKEAQENNQRFEEKRAYQQYESELENQINELKSRLSVENLDLLNEYQDLKKSFDMKNEVLATAQGDAYDYNLDKLAKIKPHLDTLHEKINTNPQIQEFFLEKDKLEKNKLSPDDLLPHEKNELVQKYHEYKETALYEMIGNLDAHDKNIYSSYKKVLEKIDFNKKRLEPLKLREFLDSIAQTAGAATLEKPFTQTEKTIISKIQNEMVQLADMKAELEPEILESPELMNVLQSQKIIIER